MAEHQCLHETDLALMAKSLQDVCGDVKDIKKALLGNGKVGLTTQQELNKAAIRRLWWAFGGSAGGLSILIIVVKFIG